MGRLYRKTPAGPWYAVIYVHGVRKRICTKMADKRAAQAELVRLEREASADKPEVAPYHTVAEALEHLIAVRGESDHYRTRAKPLIRLLGAKDVNQLHVDDLHRYIGQRLTEPRRNKARDAKRSVALVSIVGEATRTVSRHTVKKELVALGTALRLAAKRGLFVRSVEAILPDDFAAEYQPRRRHLTVAECSALLAAVDARRRPWVVLAIYTGGRRSEVESITWAHVHREEGTIEVPGTKTAGANRVVPLHPRLADFLEAYRPSRDGETIVEHWANANRDLAVACKSIGIARVTCNDLRRTFASWLIQRHVPNGVVASLLGHTTTAMVDRVYGRHSIESLTHAVERLPAPLDAATAGGEAFDAWLAVRSALGTR